MDITLKKHVFTENFQMYISNKNHVLNSSHMCDQLPMWHFYLYFYIMEYTLTNLRRSIFNMNTPHIKRYFMNLSSHLFQFQIKSCTSAFDGKI